MCHRSPKPRQDRSRRSGRGTVAAKSDQVIRFAAVGMQAATVASTALSSRAAEWRPVWLFGTLPFPDPRRPSAGIHRPLLGSLPPPAKQRAQPPIAPDTKDTGLSPLFSGLADATASRGIVPWNAHPIRTSTIEELTVTRETFGQIEYLLTESARRSGRLPKQSPRRPPADTPPDELAEPDAMADWPTSGRRW